MESIAYAMAMDPGQTAVATTNKQLNNKWDFYVSNVGAELTYVCGEHSPSNEETHANNYYIDFNSHFKTDSKTHLEKEVPTNSVKKRTFETELLDGYKLEKHLPELNLVVSNLQDGNLPVFNPTVPDLLETNIPISLLPNTNLLKYNSVQRDLPDTNSVDTNLRKYNTDDTDLLETTSVGTYLPESNSIDTDLPDPQASDSCSPDLSLPNFQHTNTLLADQPLSDVCLPDLHSPQPPLLDQAACNGFSSVCTSYSHDDVNNQRDCQSALGENVHVQSSGNNVRVRDINPLITCALCGGYFIDATTIAECLHSFCRSCIVSYLQVSNYCPVCDVQVHERHPFMGIRRDKVLQNVVYKLVPGLFTAELKRQKDYYTRHPQNIASDEKCGHLLTECWEIIPDDELISVSLELQNKGEDIDNCMTKRYLLCPAKFTIKLLKKFIRAKLSLSSKYQLEVFHTEEALNDQLTLLDVVYIYSWQKITPFRLYYTVFETVQAKPTQRRGICHKLESSTPRDMTLCSPAKSSPPKSSATKSSSSTSWTRNSSSATDSADKLSSSKSSAREHSLTERSSPSVSIKTNHSSTATYTSRKVTHRRLTMSPIYPIPEYNNLTSSDDSDDSDPTFRISTLYRKRPSTVRSNRKSNPRKLKRGSKRPVGIPEVGFYPRQSSTPKNDEHHRLNCRFSKHYVPIYKRTNYVPANKRKKTEVLNTALIDVSSLSEKDMRAHKNDTYQFEISLSRPHANPVTATPRRGRPRKSRILSPPMSVCIKRGRGRPRKYPLPVQRYIQPTESLESTAQSIIGDCNSNTSAEESNVCVSTSMTQQNMTSRIRWLKTDSPVQYIPSIPVSLNIGGINFHSIKIENFSEANESDTSITDSSTCESSTLLSTSSDISEMETSVTEEPDKVSNLKLKKSSLSDVNDDDVMYNKEIEIKQEVEEAHPHLRHIIEGRFVGKNLNELSSHNITQPCLARFQALNAGI